MSSNENQRIESFDIHGGKILVIGDLHLSSTFSGKHKSYLSECLFTLERIRDIVVAEKASAVIFLGDLIGVNEKNIKDRRFLTHVLMFFDYLNKVTNNNVYSVKGNHDIGDFSDFDMLLGLGYIRNPKYINYYGRRPGNTKDDGFEVRFHLVNYGDEHNALRIASTNGATNDVVLGHSDYYIDGVSNWYSANKNIDVARLDNFIGVSYIFSGHIHTPSIEMLNTMMKDGSNIGLFFTGAPMRTVDRYDDCWYLTFEYKEEDGEWVTGYDTKNFGLQPCDEIFYDDSEFIGTEEQHTEHEEELEKSKKLTEIVKEIIEGRITSGDLNHQIDVVPGVDEEVKKLAKDYLEKAMSGK